MKRHILIVVASSLGASLIACSAVLGFKDLTLDTSDAGDASNGGADGALQDGSGGRDGSATDAGDGADAVDAGSLVDAPVDCGDTKISSTNCGRCGHDCAGGACSSSVCQPVLMLQNLGQPVGIAVDDKRIYVAIYYDNEVAAFDKGDGGPSTVFTSGTFGPKAIAKDDTTVYFSNTNGTVDTQFIWKCSLTGCSNNPPMVTAAQHATSFALVGSTLYFTEELLGRIRAIDVRDGGTYTLVAEDAGVNPYQVAVDGTWLFFTDRTNGSLRRVRMGGGGMETLAPTATSFGVAVTDAGIFFGADDTDAGTSSVIHTDGDGGGAKLFASVDGPGGIAFDDNNVYWVNHGSDISASGTVMTCPLAGCPGGGPTVLAAGLMYPVRIAVDSTAVYWVDEGLGTGDGRVLKVAKP